MEEAKTRTHTQTHTQLPRANITNYLSIIWRGVCVRVCVCTCAVIACEHTLRLEGRRQRGFPFAARHQGEVVRGWNQAIFHVDDFAVRPVVG
jgi:hypothetical protein